MTDIHLNLTETTLNGPGTKRWVLGSSECTALAAHQIARLGIDDVVTPYSRVRLRPAGSFVMECFGGRGQVLLDGRWSLIRAGWACMAPPHVLNAFRAVSGHRWSFVWVRYDEPPTVHPLVAASSPLRVRCDTEPLRHAMEGLRNEWENRREDRLLHHWIELVHALTRRVAQPWHLNERLWKLWEGVGRDLAGNWTLGSLAKKFHSSKEHLRRLCVRELGRSPMQQLTFMRMQRAQELLERTSDKLEVVAPDVGYESALVFSRVFKRWVGCSPSHYRSGR